MGGGREEGFAGGGDGDLCGVCACMCYAWGPLQGGGRAPRVPREARKAQNAVLLVGSRGCPGAGWAPRGGRNVSEAAPGSWELRTCSCPLPELSSAAPVRATAANCPGQLKLLFNSFGRTYLFNLHCRILFKS